MNDNVGEMPLEIFGDYISDNLGMDFPWVYLIPILNGGSYSNYLGDIGEGFGYGYTDFGTMTGLGNGHGNVDYCYLGFGSKQGRGHDHKGHGCGA